MLPQGAMEPAERFRLVADAPLGQARSHDLEALEECVKKGEIRDFDFSDQFYEDLCTLVRTAWSWRGKEAQADVWCAERIFLGVTKVPEFQPARAEAHAPEHWLRALASRADGTAAQEEWPLIRDIYLWAYGFFPSKRPLIRSLVGKSLRSAGHFVHKSAPVGPLLETLLPIIRGFSVPLGVVHRSLLVDILLPLHRSNDWLQWDRQTPLLGMFHKELVQCIMLILEKQPAWAPKSIEVVCSHFPTAREANTPKEVLISYEVSQLLRYVEKSALKSVLPPLLRHMTRLVSSHNAQPIQSVLQYWKEDHVVELFKTCAAEIIPVMVPALLRGGEPFWNPTVNRMTTLVLEKLEESNPEVFREVLESLWGPGKQRPSYVAARAAQALAAKLAHEEAAKQDEEARAKAKPQDVSSLSYCLGGWRPPGGGSGGGSGSKPPLTATGVAPWAVGAGVRGAAGSAGGKQPPLTATGVAPWAFKGGPVAAKPGPLGQLQAAGGAPRPPLGAAAGAIDAGAGGGGAVPPSGGGARGALPAAFLEEEEEEEDAKSGLDRLRDYVKILCPENSGMPAAGTASWEAALTAEAPTLLPTLKFHQLVFGAEDIASGAFSVVRYARTIIKDKTQSQWPEYAVKVINTKTIQDHGYEGSVNREIVILKMLSHPNIARMVSAFRWRDGAYLVLEWAAKGDLHTILVQQGKLPEVTVRFFVGEIVAALVAVHQLGFVYGDLKPENVVITSTCHAKLTDFGGCRPVTEEAQRRTKQSLLRRLRDGDWRAQDGAAEAAEPEPAEDDVVAYASDGRVEGTMLYLPPEVVHGAVPTQAADAWALGCLQYQLLTGKPPIWADSEREEDLKAHIVSFSFDAGAALEPLSALANGLVGRLLTADVTKRLSVEGAAHDPFFEGADVFTLYTKPRGPEVAAAQRKAASEGDERWQKRQFSKIWSVMPSPQDYVLPMSVPVRPVAGAVVPSFAETPAESAAPFCDEADASPDVRREPRIESL